MSADRHCGTKAQAPDIQVSLIQWVKFASAGDAADDPQKQTREQQGTQESGTRRGPSQGHTRGTRCTKRLCTKTSAPTSPKVQSGAQSPCKFKVIRPTPHTLTLIIPHHRIWILLVHSSPKKRPCKHRAPVPAMLLLPSPEQAVHGRIVHGPPVWTPPLPATAHHTINQQRLRFTLQAGRRTRLLLQSGPYCFKTHLQGHLRMAAPCQTHIPQPRLPVGARLPNNLTLACHPRPSRLRTTRGRML